MKYLLFLITPFILIADVIDYVTVENLVSLQTKNLSFKNSDYLSDDTQKYSRALYANKLEAKYEDWKVCSVFNLFQNSKSTKLRTTYAQYIRQEKNGYNFDKLYLQYMISYEDFNIGFAYGVIPFTGGNFKQYSYQDKVEGNGLFTLINITIVGGWGIITNKDKTTVMKIGYGKWKKDNFYQNYDIPNILSSSGGLFSSLEHHTETLNFNHLFQLDYYKIDTVLNNKDHEVSDVFGVGYSTESYENGYVLYTILSKNYTKTLNKKKSSTKVQGSSILLGVKKYIDVFDREFAIGGEYFNSSENFFSASSGDLWSSDYGNFTGNEFTLNKVYFDFIMNKNIVINISGFNKTYKNNIYNDVSGVQTGISYDF